MDKFWMIVNVADHITQHKAVENLDDAMRPKTMYFNKRQAMRVIVEMANRFPEGEFALLEMVEVKDEELEAQVSKPVGKPDVVC